MKSIWIAIPEKSDDILPVNHSLYFSFGLQWWLRACWSLSKDTFVFSLGQLSIRTPTWPKVWTAVFSNQCILSCCLHAICHLNVLLSAISNQSVKPSWWNGLSKSINLTSMFTVILIWCAFRLLLGLRKHPFHYLLNRISCFVELRESCTLVICFKQRHYYSSIKNGKVFEKNCLVLIHKGFKQHS